MYIDRCYLHASLWHSHVEVVEDNMLVRPGAVRLPGSSDTHRILPARPHCALLRQQFLLRHWASSRRHPAEQKDEANLLLKGEPLEGTREEPIWLTVGLSFSEFKKLYIRVMGVLFISFSQLLEHDYGGLGLYEIYNTT